MITRHVLLFLAFLNLTFAFHCKVDCGIPDRYAECPEGCTDTNCNPCKTMECANHPTALCRVDHCGAECTAVWCDGGKDVTQSCLTVSEFYCKDYLPHHKECPDGHKVGRDPENNCFFFSCSCKDLTLESILPTLQERSRDLHQENIALSDFEVIDDQWPITIQYSLSFIDHKRHQESPHRWMYMQPDPKAELLIEKEKKLLDDILDRSVADPSLIVKYKGDPTVLKNFSELFKFNYYERSFGFRSAEKIIAEFDAIVASLPFTIDDATLASCFARELPMVLNRPVDVLEKLPYSLEQLKKMARDKGAAVEERQKGFQEANIKQMLESYSSDPNVTPEDIEKFEAELRKSMEFPEIVTKPIPYDQIPDILHLITKLSQVASTWIGETPDLVTSTLSYSDEAEGHYKVVMRIKKCDSPSPCNSEPKKCWDGSLVHRNHFNECDFDACPKSCYGSPEKGGCSEEIVRYYWDSSTVACRPFIWSGCGENGNNFETKIECEDRCGLKTDL